MTDEMEQRLQEFKDKIGFDKEITKEDLINALENAMRDRGLYVYFIWRALQELHPEIDAKSTLAHALRNYGLYKSKGLGEVTNAAEAMLNQSSRNGMLVFDQKFVALSDDHAEKHIYNCPLINAFKEVGCTTEECVTLCRDILMCGDFAMLEPWSDIVELTFPKCLADEDVCEMCVKTKK